MKKLIFLFIMFLSVTVHAQFYGGGLIPHGDTLPSTCADIGQLFILDTTNTLYSCSATDTWTAISGGGGGGEDETHAYEHEPNGNDPVLGWYWGGALTVGDATPEVKSGYIYDCTGATTVTILDFVDSSGNHSEFRAGSKIRIFMNDSDVTLGCDVDDHATTKLKCNANTDFTGGPSQVVVVDFVYRASTGLWYSPTLNMGYSSATVFPVTLKIGTASDGASGHNFTDAELFGHGTYWASGAGVWNLTAIQEGMAFCLESTTTGDVDVNPDNSDIMTVDGTAGSAGDAFRGSDIGDMICCEYYSANNWRCSSYAANGTNNFWTDVN